jgi:hypothetical protein
MGGGSTPQGSKCITDFSVCIIAWMAEFIVLVVTFIADTFGMIIIDF